MATCAGWFSLPNPHSRPMWNALQQHLPSCWHAMMAQVRPDTIVIHFPQCCGLKHALPGESPAFIHIIECNPAHSCPKAAA